MACLALSLALAMLLAPAARSAGSLQGGQALQELQHAAQTPETNTSTAKTSTSSTATGTSETTNSRNLILLALGAAVLLLSAIAFVIVRDARKVAPAVDGEAVERSATRDSVARLRNRRAKAKAARRQRKRNR